MNHACRSCLVLFLALTALSFAQTNVGPAGHWEGSLKTPAGELKLIVDLSRDADNKWIGDIDIPDQMVKDLPLRNISVTGDAVSFALPAGPGDPVFKGKLSPDGSSISGELSQGGGAVPFTLKRTGEAKVVVPEKIPALPEKLTGKWEGTLNTPEGSLHLVFNFSNKDGLGGGTIDSPDQGATGIPMSSISVSDNAVKIGVQVISGEYKGKLSEDGKTMTGEWFQGGATLALVLSKKP